MQKNYYLVLITFLVLTACQSKVIIFDKDSTLYAELGGATKINIAITVMVKRLHGDERLGDLFTDVNDVELIQNFNDFICQLSDGGCEYHGAEMEDTHVALFITKAEFDRFVSLFIYSMEDAKISFSAQNKLLKKLANLRDSVIEL